MNPDGSGKRKVTRISGDLDGGSRGGGEWTPLGIAYWDAGGIGFVKSDGRRGKIEIQLETSGRGLAFPRTDERSRSRDLSSRSETGRSLLPESRKASCRS